MKFSILSRTFCSPEALNPEATIDELVSLVARNTTLTAAEIEARLLDVINEMLENYEPKEGK